MRLIILLASHIVKSVNQGSLGESEGHAGEEGHEEDATDGREEGGGGGGGGR